MPPTLAVTLPSAPMVVSVAFWGITIGGLSLSPVGVTMLPLASVVKLPARV